MTALDCCVTTCGYNDDNCCCRSEIDVKGTKADVRDDTCCGSFKEGDCLSSNSISSPNTSLVVSCEATNCVYNDSCRCSAEHIDIAGSGAGNATQTVCSSFTCK